MTWKQLTLDGNVQETQVKFMLDGSKRAHEQAKREGAFAWLVSGAFYDSHTDVITINLDVLIEAVLRDSWHDTLSVKRTDLLIWEFTKTMSHEYMHSVLRKLVSEKACHALDNIAEKEVFPHG
jgi:hypothetical protein